MYLKKKPVFHHFKIAKLIAITIKMTRGQVLVKIGLQFQVNTMKLIKEIQFYKDFNNL